MQIILFTNDRRRQWRFGRTTLVVLGLAMVTATVLACLTGVHIGAQQMQFSQTDGVHSAADVQQLVMTQKVGEERALTHAMRRETESHLNALALKLGEMQARITRLDALGERLAGLAKLKRGEFDFSSVPGLGGAEEAELSRTTEVADLARDLQRLLRDMEDRGDKLTALETLLLERKLEQETRPGGVPLAGGWTTSGYGTRTNPVTGRREFHRGIDYTGAPNSKVLSMAAGIVITAERHNAYGNMVEIRHGNGYVTRYAHNKKILANVGDKVDKGQAIAIMGATGRATGAHVHFEVMKDGHFVNPAKFIRADAAAQQDETPAPEDTPENPHSVY